MTESSRVVFEIFSDRIEITSTGGLSTIKNLEDFFSGLNRILKAYSKDSFVVKENFMRNVFYTNKKAIKQDEGTNEGINTLYDFIKNNPSLRVSQIAMKINKPSKTLERWIKQLKDEDKIKFTGSKKTGGYTII